jgi:hypothetical protein
MGIARCGKWVAPKKSQWTAAEMQLLRLHDDLQIARMTGKTLRVIAAKRKKLKPSYSH